MNVSDFEPANGHLIGRKMFNVSDRRNRMVLVKKRRKPNEKKMKMKYETSFGFEGEQSYPVNSDKKIFGMKPRTLVVALGVIVISIFILKSTASTNVEMANGGIPQ